MMPTSGTITEPVTPTRRRTARKTIVPANANRLATAIFASGGASGATSSMASTPRPAHSLVPAVVGSTNLFWVIICMITPLIVIAMAAKINANVRGTREIHQTSACAGSDSTPQGVRS